MIFCSRVCLSIADDGAAAAGQKGRRAIQMLLELIENLDQPAQRVELPTDLIVRASTRAIK